MAIQLLLILKANFYSQYNFVKHIAKFAPIITISRQINELEKILTGPGKLSGVSRKGPLVCKFDQLLKFLFSVSKFPKTAIL